MGGCTDPKTDEEIKGCVNIVREPNELLATVRDRMPVILTAVRAYAWLNPEASAGELNALMEPLPSSRMKGGVAGD